MRIFASPMLPLLAAAAIVSACGGGGDDPPAPTTGSVYFQMDSVTCAALPVAMTFLIDGLSVGTETLTARDVLRDRSRAFPTSAGNHVLAARAADGRSWVPSTRTVPAGGSFTLILDCAR